MVKVDVSVEARADLLELHIQSTIRFGLEVAEEYIEGINAALARLAEFPQSGPVFPGIRPPVRYLAYKRHHILYDSMARPSGLSALSTTQGMCES